jgi:hypothetical protein
VENLPELPEGWCWATVEQLAAINKYALAIGPFGSNLKVEDYRSEGVPLIFVRNIRSKVFNGMDTKYISFYKYEELQAHKVVGGDILITKMGDPPGDACLYPEDNPPAVITADCIKWTLTPILTARNFFVISINSSLVRNQIISITKGVAQQKVSLQRFSQVAIPLPPLTEQEQIISEVEARLSNLAQLEATIEANLKRAEHERQSILLEAFAGRLVEQDPGDVPASVLLERIREERKRREAAEEIRRRENKMVMNRQRGKRKDRAPLYDVLVKAGGELTPEELYKNSEAQRKKVPVEEQEENFYIELDAEVAANLIEEVKQVDQDEVLLRAIEPDDPCLEENKESKEGDIVIANEMRQAREFPLVNVVELPEGEMRQSREFTLASVEESPKGKKRKVGEEITRLSLWDV